MPYVDLSKGKVSQPHNIYHVVTVTKDRMPYFSDFHLGRIVINAMRKLHEANHVHSLAWVLMPEHLHWLFQLGENESLSQIVKRLKGTSAREINKILHQNGSIWQRAFYDHALRQEEDIIKFSRYMIANPIRRGLVSEINRYPLWDSIWAQDFITENTAPTIRPAD